MFSICERDIHTPLLLRQDMKILQNCVRIYFFTLLQVLVSYKYFQLIMQIKTLFDWSEINSTVMFICGRDLNVKDKWEV